MERLFSFERDGNHEWWVDKYGVTEEVPGNAAQIRTSKSLNTSDAK
jgi:hypothetical protein